MCIIVILTFVESMFNEKLYQTDSFHACICMCVWIYIYIYKTQGDTGVYIYIYNEAVLMIVIYPVASAGRIVLVSPSYKISISQCQVYATQWVIVPDQNQLAVVTNVWYHSAGANMCHGRMVSTLATAVSGDGCLYDSEAPVRYWQLPNETFHS